MQRQPVYDGLSDRDIATLGRIRDNLAVEAKAAAHRANLDFDASTYRNRQREERVEELALIDRLLGRGDK